MATKPTIAQREALGADLMRVGVAIAVLGIEISSGKTPVLQVHIAMMKFKNELERTHAQIKMWGP